MIRLTFVCASMLALPLVAYAQQTPRSLVLQANPSPFPLRPPPQRPQGAVRPQAGPTFEPAPTPNRDAFGPSLPRASNDPELSPTLFTRRNQYRGDGYSPGSTAQEEQERKVMPGAGFNLRMPLTPK